MRVSVKMTLGLSSTCLVIVGLHGYLQIRQENKDLRTAVEREIRLLGSAVQVGVENALRDRQMEDIQETLDSMEGIDPSVDILVYDSARALKAQSIGSSESDRLKEMARSVIKTGLPELRWDESEPPGRIALALPLRGGTTTGGLLLVRPLIEMRRDLHDTSREIVVSVLLLVLAVAALQFLLGTAYVTRPLTRMAGAMKRVRSGDLSLRLADARRDEVGALAGEFDSMVGDLLEARERVAREIESRVSLERGLQQADKLITVGQISAGLAHEIGSPLQIMNGRARALLAREHTPEEIRKNMEILAAQTDRIARIVDQLLKVSRRRSARLAAHDLRSPVQTVLDLVEHTARRREVAIELRCAEEMPPVVADVDQIQQVILNLSKNALEATAPGGRISITIEPSTLTSADGSRVVPAARLVVEDTGHGMPPEILERLFEPFFSTRSAEGGTGLGLAVVKAIVTEHGGTVTATSEPGKGSRFTIHLPLSGPQWMGDLKEAS